MVLVHQLNSKDVNCIQAVKVTEIGSHVVVVRQLNSKVLNLPTGSAVFLFLETFCCSE